MTVRDILIFVTGVGVGVGASYKFINDKLTAKHESELAEEKESIKKVYSQYAEKDKKENDDIAEDPKEVEYTHEEKTRYEELVHDYSGIDDEEEITDREGPDLHKPGVYEISYNEFGNAGYEESQLTYYLGDQVLTDENDEEMDETEICLCLGSLDILQKCQDGKYIYIRNEELEYDYEIALSNMSFHQSES